MTLSEAVIGLEAYKKVEDRMGRLWQDIDEAIVGPRMDPDATEMYSFQVNEVPMGFFGSLFFFFFFYSSNLFSNKRVQNVLEKKGTAGNSVDELFKDLTTIVGFLARRLPPDLLVYLGPIMMSNVVPRLIELWLSSAIPVSLKDIDEFQAVIQSAKSFCGELEELGISGFTELKEWVGNAPSTWLAKRTATTLDTVRKQLSQGPCRPTRADYRISLVGG